MSCVFKGHAVAISGLGENFNGFLETQSGKRHAIWIGLAEAQPARFPQVSHSLVIETEKLRPDDIGGNWITACDDQAGFHRMPAQWPRADHRRMPGNDRQV